MNKALRGLRGFAAATSLAILVQGLGTIALTPGADALDGQVTTTTRVHVRTGPSTSNKSLTVLNKGDKLTAEERTATHPAGTVYTYELPFAPRDRETDFCLVMQALA